MIYIISYIIGWIIGIAFYFTRPENGFINCVLLSHLVFTVGFFGLFNFIGHSLFSEKVANRIGWISKRTWICIIGYRYLWDNVFLL